MAKKFKNYNVVTDVNNTVHQLRNKYFNLYRSQFKWTGLNYRQEEYVMKELWAKGTVACSVDHGELIFAPWAMTAYDMYGFPEKVNLINLYGVPFIKNTAYVVDKDCVLGYLQANHKGLAEIVDWYIFRIAEVEQVIAINLQLHKIPFLIPTDKENVNKLKDLVDRIIAGELVITAETDEAELLKCIQTDAPYIIDKLMNYKRELEGELKTLLTVNNSAVAKIEQVQLAEANSNNDEINDNQIGFLKELEGFCNRIKETLGVVISIESTSEPVQVDGEIHDRMNKTGPKEELEEDEL